MLIPDFTPHFPLIFSCNVVFSVTPWWILIHMWQDAIMTDATVLTKNRLCAVTWKHMVELVCKLDCVSTGGQILPVHIHVQKVCH